MSSLMTFTRGRFRPSGALLTVSILAAVSVSCVMLDLKTSDAEAVDSAVGFSCEWPDKAAKSACDSAYVLMNRSTEGIRYLYAVPSAGEFPDTVAVFGQYVSLAYSLNSTDYTIALRNDFLSSSEAYIRDFTAVAGTVPAEDLAALRGGSDLDFNASYRFVNLPTQIYSKSQLLTVSDVGENRFTFSLEPLLMKLNLNFTVRCASSVEITFLTAELSGVPFSINIKDGSTSASDLGRVIFPVTRRSDGSCNAIILLTGLYPSESSGLMTGPGILRLSLKAVCDGKEKMMHPALNLRDELVSQNVMVPALQEGRYVTSSKELFLTVGNVLTITADSFVSGDGGDGVTEWFDSERTVDVEL